MGVRCGYIICGSLPYENIAGAPVETTYLRYAKCHHSGDDKEADQAYAMSSSSEVNGDKNGNPKSNQRDGASACDESN